MRGTPKHLTWLAAAVLAAGACSDDASTATDAAVDLVVGDGSSPVVDRGVQPDATAPGDAGTAPADSAQQADAPPTTGAIIADHSAAAAFSTIPTSALNAARQKLGKIFYGHTSHGSQIVTGLEMLESEDGAKYAMPTLIEPWADLGHTGDTAWVQQTKTALGQPNHGIKMVVWSWCAGVSDNTQAGINMYLAEMTKLEQQYPGIVFVYMTGHLDGTGPTGNLYRGNDQIRDYCTKNDKVLFDFADIESYDPAGTYYPNEDDSCGWCTTWCGSHTCPSCSDCAHSHCFNCYLKGKGFWWLLARVAGWSGA